MLKSVYDVNDNGIVDDSASTAAHAGKHQDGGSDEIDVAGLLGRKDLVDRGDFADYDFEDFPWVADDLFHDLDLSEKIPVNAFAVWMNVQFLFAAANSYIYFAKKGNVNYYNALVMNSVAPNILHIATGIVFCDENRKISYAIKPGPVPWIGITIGGWWI